jgi:hypothetical protein
MAQDTLAVRMSARCSVSRIPGSSAIRKNSIPGDITQPIVLHPYCGWETGSAPLNAQTTAELQAICILLGKRDLANMRVKE